EVPKTEIIVIGLYNPNVRDLAAVGIPPAVSDGLAAQINAAVAATAGACEGRVAGPLPAFNPGPPADECPPAAALALIDALVHDIHPTDAGYQAMANVVFKASGYSRLAE